MAEAPLTEHRNRKSPLLAQRTREKWGTRRPDATVFLGGGRITSALLAGLRLAHYRGPIVVHDRHVKKLRALERQFHVETASSLMQALRRAKMLIVAVRPDSVANVLGEVASILRPARPNRLVAVSLAAGVPLQRLRAQLGTGVRWVRAMPSPVCRAGSGLTALTFDGAVTRAERTQVRKFFASVGSVLEIPESKFDVFTATYSSSHGYHALATLAKAAEAAGLDQKTALIAASHALADGIQYWRHSGQSLSDLLREAATPGGVAAATIEAMDEAGYQQTVTQGLRAGIEQARRNANY